MHHQKRSDIATEKVVVLRSAYLKTAKTVESQNEVLTKMLTTMKAQAEELRAKITAIRNAMWDRSKRNKSYFSSALSDSG